MRHPEKLILSGWLAFSLIAGCGGGGGGGGGNGGTHDHPPVVENVAVTPNLLDFDGGSVAITAEATDADGDALTVRAAVQAPGQASVPVPMAKGSGDEYRGTYTAMGNASLTEVVYEVRVTADDGYGHTATEPPAGQDPVRFQVSPVEAPPDPPAP